MATSNGEQVHSVESNVKELVESIDSRIQGQTKCEIGADEWLTISNALCAEQVSASGPEGWRLVPDGKVSLPKEMFDAGNKCFADMGGFNPYSVYVAMLAAAPNSHD